MRCLDTGMYADWRLTEAQSNTFLDVGAGHGARSASATACFDAAGGTAYFRRWLQESIDGLKAAVERRGR